MRAEDMGFEFDFGLDTRRAALYRDIVEHCADGIVILDENQRITYLNRSAETLFGHPLESIAGRPLDVLIPPEQRDAHHGHVRRFQQAGTTASQMENRTVRIQALRANGSRVPVSVSILRSDGRDGSHYVAIVRDISRREALERELEKLAGTDPLTGELNRRTFLARLDQESARSVRHGRPLTLALIDIDRFKQVNDTFGHVVGDHAICHVIEVLSDTLRRSDVIARWGGDEIVVMLPESDAEAGLGLAARLCEAVADTPLADRAAATPSIGITVSIGVADLDLATGDYEMLIRDADRALYRAKSEGRNRAAGVPD